MTVGFPGDGVVIVPLLPPQESMVFVDGAISEDISPFRLLIWFDGWWGFWSPYALGSTLLVFPKVGI